MIWGLSAANFTLLHVLISLIGIVAGLIVMFGMLTGRKLSALTALFLATTVLTSVTGFAFPTDHPMPSQKIGLISLVVLVAAIAARYLFHLTGAWRPIYVICASLALYLNVFVLIVQLFEKVPALKVLAPTQSEPPFLIAQVVVLALFIGLTVFATKRFHILPTLATA